MEINITRFFNDASPMDYSASVAEIGRDAGPDTWRAAVEAFDDYVLLTTDEERAAMRAYAKEFGAWTEEAIAAWSDAELNALLIQMVAGDMREAGLTPESTVTDWQAYEDNESCSHRIFRTVAGNIYFYIGS